MWVKKGFEPDKNGRGGVRAPRPHPGARGPGGPRRGVQAVPAPPYAGSAQGVRKGCSGGVSDVKRGWQGHWGPSPEVRRPVDAAPHRLPRVGGGLRCLPGVPGGPQRRSRASPLSLKASDLPYNAPRVRASAPTRLPTPPAPPPRTGERLGGRSRLRPRAARARSEPLEGSSGPEKFFFSHLRPFWDVLAKVILTS